MNKRKTILKTRKNNPGIFFVATNLVPSPHSPPCHHLSLPGHHHYHIVSIIIVIIAVVIIILSAL